MCEGFEKILLEIFFFLSCPLCARCQSFCRFHWHMEVKP